MRRALTLLLISALLPAASQAAEWRVRARETLDTGVLDLGDGRGGLDFKGFSSCFNLFHEEPFRHGIGLTLHRGALSRIGGPDGLTVTTLGAEGKLFPTRAARLWFVRGGLLAQALDPAGPPKDFWNYGFSLGTGIEFPVWRLGLAPEIGSKLLWGARGRSTRTLYVSLGVHFYVFPGDE